MRRTWLAGALLLLAGPAAACSDDGEEASPPTPAEEAEAGVATVLDERFEGEDVTVRCPDDLDVTTVASFTCDVVVSGSEPVEVSLGVDADGTVSLRRAVVPTAAAEAYLATELAVAAEGPVEPDCGPAPLLVADVGDVLECDVVRTSDGAERLVHITVLDLDGTVSYAVEVPTSTTVAPPVSVEPP